MIPKEYFQSQELWHTDEIYSEYRIPGMLVTQQGTLLVYCEARKSHNDWALMDILLQRSIDGGNSFSEPVLLAKGTDLHPTVNNPVMVQDKNGRIHLLHCEDYGINGGRILRRYSDDDGVTWSAPIEITDATLPEYRNAFAIGPGHGICTHEGTLICPVWMVPKEYNSPLTSHKPSVISTLYSKDNGETWSCGEVLSTTPMTISPTETEVALLADGTVYLNCRFGGGLTYRGHAYSKSGYSNWKSYEADQALIDPACFGSVVSFQPKGKTFTLLFANCASKTTRRLVTVKGSHDGGRTWTICKTLDVDRGGYVELAATPCGDRIYVLYETAFGSTCQLVTFNYAWLEENNEVEQVSVENK